MSVRKVVGRISKQEKEGIEVKLNISLGDEFPFSVPWDFETRTYSELQRLSLDELQEQWEKEIT